MTKQDVVQMFQRNIEELTAQNPHAEVRERSRAASYEKPVVPSTLDLDAPQRLL